VPFGFSTFVSVVAALYHERRKPGTRRLGPSPACHRQRGMAFDWWPSRASRGGCL